MGQTTQFINDLVNDYHTLYDKLGCDKPKFLEFIKETKDIVNAFSELHELTLLAISYHIYEKDSEVHIDPIYRFNDSLGDYNFEGIQKSLDACLQKDYI